MQNEMIGKIALVTGGSREHGRNMALRLAKKNIDLVLTFNSNREEACWINRQRLRVGEIS